MKNTVDHLVRLFGTQRSVAEAAERAENTVSTWRKTGVPISAALRIARNAHKQDVSITREQILVWIDQDERNAATNQDRQTPTMAA